MKYQLKIYNKLNCKACLNALSICILSLMTLHIHAAEKTNTSNQEAAMNAVAALLNVNDVKEVVTAELPADVKTAVEDKLLSKIKINKVEMDAAVTSVLRDPIYKIEPVLDYIAVVDGEVLDLNYHGTAAILSGYLKLIRDDFVLDSAEKAKVLGKAFEHEFPYKSSEEFKQPVMLDKGWLLIRNEFFGDHSGLVFTTDKKGKITLVEYVLKINPEDYSYEAPTDITL